MWGLLIVLWLPVAILSAGDAAADGLTPVEITLLGPGAVRVRLAEGHSFPCDSGDNRRLVEGKFEPGTVVRATTPEHCLCLQQTYEPFTDSDWSQSALVCRPQVCKRRGKGQTCVSAPDPTIRLLISSQRP